MNYHNDENELVTTITDPEQKKIEKIRHKPTFTFKKFSNDDPKRLRIKKIPKNDFKTVEITTTVVIINK